MRKTVSFLCIAILCLICPIAEGASLSTQQNQEIISKINKKASGIKSMSCSFIQTKHLSMLNEKMESNGKMTYKQPDKLRWEYIKPYSYLFIFDGTKVYVGNKSRKDVIDTGSNKIFKEVAAIMMNTVTGKALSNSTEFNIKVNEDKIFYQITLVPKKKELKQMFTSILLYFKKTDSMISEIEITEKNGDKSIIKLKDIVINGTVNESAFTIPK